MKRAALYLRVSTAEQTVENQRPELEQLARSRGYEIVASYEESASAAKARSRFAAMLYGAHRGLFDVVIVWSLDRFGRSMAGNLNAVLELDRRGVQVVSVRESWLDMGGPARQLMIAIMSWVAEQERDRLVERTKAGIDRARRQGVRLGRPTKRIDKNEVDMLLAEGLSLDAVAKRIGCGRSTLFRSRSGKAAQ